MGGDRVITEVLLETREGNDRLETREGNDRVDFGGTVSGNVLGNA